MKNDINYYYNINVEEIHQINKKIKFENNMEKYILEPFKRKKEELDDIFKLQYYLIKIGFNNNEIILNKNNKIITQINGIDYIMTKTKKKNKKIQIEDILIFNNINTNENNFNNIVRKNWYDLWIKKIDYLEYQIEQFGKKYKMIRNSNAYFIGMAENSIQLLSTLEKNNLRLTISHDRTYITTSQEDFYNPINFIIDDITRDISEYIKDCIINDIEVNEIIKKYINYNHLNEYEIKKMFIRILYPSYYIDMCEKIFEGKEQETKLKKIIEKIDTIENKIKKIYITIKKITNIPEIEWLLKN